MARGVRTLGTVMSAPVVTAPLLTSVAEAVAMMARKGIGSVVVMEGDQALGILTRGAALALIADGADPSLKTLGDAMTSPLQTLDLHTPIVLAIEAIRARNGQRMGVVDRRDRLVGIVSQGDLIRASRDELTDLSRELLRMDDMKSEFIKNVSHELRTPLAAIDGAISNILDGVYGEPPPAQQKYLEIIHRNARRLGKIVEDLLTISELESGRYATEVEEISLTEVVAEVLEQFGDFAARKQVSLGSTVPSEVRIVGDRGMIATFLSHLVMNGVKFTPSGGGVRVTAEDRGDYIKGCVADTGPGVREEDRESIFEKFHQVGREDGPGERGTGLGLAICRHILDVHKGRIWVESEVGKGSRFFFVIPKRPPAAPVTNAEK